MSMMGKAVRAAKAIFMGLLAAGMASRAGAPAMRTSQTSRPTDQNQSSNKEQDACVQGQKVLWFSPSKEEKMKALLKAAKLIGRVLSFIFATSPELDIKPPTPPRRERRNQTNSGPRGRSQKW